MYMYVYAGTHEPPNAAKERPTIPGLISCAGVTRSMGATCHAHVHCRLHFMLCVIGRAGVLSYNWHDFSYYNMFIYNRSCPGATRKRKAGLITSVEIGYLGKRYQDNRRFAIVDSVSGNGFLQKLCCYARETGDRTEKRSCQNVGVCW